MAPNFDKQNMGQHDKSKGNGKRPQRKQTKFEHEETIHCPYPIIDNFIIVEKRKEKREQHAKLENLYEYKDEIFVRGQLVDLMQNMEQVPEQIDDDEMDVVGPISGWRIDFQDYTAPFILVQPKDGPEFALARPNTRYITYFHPLEMKAKMIGKLFYLLLSEPTLTLKEASATVCIICNDMHS